MDFDSNFLKKKSRIKEVYWQKNGPIESSSSNLGATESGNSILSIYKGETEQKALIPIGL